MPIHDITPLVSPRLGVWPGDTPMTREVLLDIDDGANITLSTLRATVHLGAHADAPNHYVKNGEAIDQRSVERYIGPCQVVRVEVGRGERVGEQHFADRPRAERVLFHTETFPDPEHWNEDFAAFEPAFVERMHEMGVMLLGIDTPSVDLFDSKDLPAHQVFAECDMAILEGIVLRGIPEGLYELIALPLKLEGFDASPVRAVLRD